MADLPSILGGMAQGFIDFGKGAVDLFGTGGAAIGDLVESARTGKVTTKNQDDFRKWLYQTDSTKDAAAKGLGTTLNGVQTALDYIPGVNALTRNPLGNAAQGALGGLADEFKTYGENYDLGRAGQRAAVSAAGAAASGSLADALKGSSNALLSSNAVQGLARGATGGAISGGGYAAIDGGDVMQSALQGAGTGALIGGATGAFQDFKPAKTYDMALTDSERAARIANAQKQLDDLGPIRLFTDDPDELAKRARVHELRDTIKAYQSGYDTLQDYTDAMATKRANRANRANTQSATTTQGQVYAPNIGEIEYDAPVQDGYTRLYRGMTQEFDPQYNRNAMDNMNGYESWTDNYDLANRYGAGEYVYSVDVPTSRIASSLYDENPNSATYGDRNFIASIEKPAGLDGITGNEYLLNTNDKLRSGLTYNRVNAPRALESTLADADMAVNSAKIAPGQLGLFDDMPTQTPRTGTRQTSLFDQPDNPYLDYYGADIDATPLTPETPANPYAPVNGEVTQAMRDRAADILGNWKKNGVPENELYNAINPDTLPLGYKEAIDVLDNMDAKKYLKDNLGVTDIKKAKFDKVLDYLFGDNEDAKRTYSELRDQQIQSAKEKAKLLGLPEPSKSFVPSVEGKLREEVSYKMAKDIRKSLRDIPVDAETGEVMPLTQANLNRLDPKVHSFRTGYTAAADEAFSERLGIAPGNTPKYNGRMDVRNAYGRYSHPMYGVGGDLAIFERKIDNPEDAISSVAHERLHSFQNEATNSANNAGRYSKEVENAFRDLRKDLEGHYKSWDETAKRYGGGRGNVYWNSQKEQEARMLETYLQNKGYADAPNMKDKYRAGEWGNEINPAFDKFFDKLRDLSKRGIALPALTALFGGGAYMARQNNDKEKEVK